MSSDEELIALFCAQLSLARALTAAYPGRVVVLRCHCRDSLMLYWVARGEIAHVSQLAWN